MRDVEIQKETCELKCKSKEQLEKLRHQNIMEELKFMAKHKITSFVRGNNDKVVRGEIK